jgi:hypothetical protein
VVLFELVVPRDQGERGRRSEGGLVADMQSIAGSLAPRLGKKRQAGMRGRNTTSTLQVLVMVIVRLLCVQVKGRTQVRVSFFDHGSRCHGCRCSKNYSVQQGRLRRVRRWYDGIHDDR